jgi:RHS repeat-associated protein
MLVPNRHGGSADYRYGFNNKEKDDDIMGEGNWEDYGMRTYNPRIGRFFATDPLTKQYPALTPYQFSSNTPIWAIDLDGLEAKYSTDGSFIEWGDIKGDKAPVVLVTEDKINNKVVDTHEEYLKYGNKPVTNFEFEEYAAHVYNEAKGLSEEGKQKIADAIYNMKEGLKKDYPALKDPSLQTVVDKINYGKDSQEQRMSSERANPKDTDVIPGTITKKNPKGTKLANICTKSYQDYFNTAINSREENKSMKQSTKVVLKSLQRDTNTRLPKDKNGISEDKANGKSHWRAGKGKNKGTNVFR